ncbi:MULTISPECIES: hypothetical protein [Microbacterium]|uniref:hypothetical protein n=1 Tax=Microbacterium TaxID=33882 RepID=UPI001878F47E|nr:MULTISPECIES: hypothetical protein [unclassified Microbacterium]
MAAKSEEAIARARARAKAWREANPERVAAWGKQYREAHSEKIDEQRRAWRDGNREQIASQRKAAREANPERDRETQRRARERRRSRELRRLAHNAHSRLMRERDPEAARERSRRFREEHPDKVREYQRRYRERHPERARQNQAMAAQRHRDANAEAIRERQRSAAAERRQQRPDAYRQWYERNLEEQRARGREASRLRSRLKKAGLPPRNIHRAYAADRRANDAAADRYFRRERSVEELAVIATELEQRGNLRLPRSVRELRRDLMDGPLPAAYYLQQSVENRDPRDESGDFTSQRYLTALKRMRNRELEALREQHEQGLQNIHAQRPQIYEHLQLRRRAALREEIQMDSIARVARGLKPYDIDHELRVRLDKEVTPVVNAKLTEVKEHTLQRVDEILARYGEVSDPAAPYRAPGATPTSGPGLR